MTLHAPQLIYLALVVLSLGISMAKHGTPKEGNHSIFVDVIAVSLGCLLLYWGGFFG